MRWNPCLIDIAINLQFLCSFDVLIDFYCIFVGIEFVSMHKHPKIPWNLIALKCAPALESFLCVDLSHTSSSRWHDFISKDKYTVVLVRLEDEFKINTCNFEYIRNCGMLQLEFVKRRLPIPWNLQIKEYVITILTNLFPINIVYNIYRLI